MKRIQIKMPDEMYHMAKVAIGDGNMSSFVRESIDNYLKGGEDKESIQKEIQRKEREILILRQKLDDKLKEEEIEKDWINKTDGYTKACNAITRIHDNIGYIGKNQIYTFSSIWNCNKSELLDFCKTNNYTVKNYGAVPQ